MNEQGKKTKLARRAGASRPATRRRAGRKSSGIDADTAKLTVAEYCLFHYPTLFTAGVPRSCTWNGAAALTVPIVLTHPDQGVIGEAGEAVVDARTGQVVSSTARAELIAQAKRMRGA
jgi:hypothetical protein